MFEGREQTLFFLCFLCLEWHLKITIATIYCALLGARHFKYIILFNPHSNHMGKMLLHLHIYKWDNWNIEKLIDRPQNPCYKVVGLGFKCHWPGGAPNMIVELSNPPFLSHQCNLQMQSGITFLRIILLPTVLLLIILPTSSLKFMKSSFQIPPNTFDFAQLFLFLLPWGYNNFLSHFYNFHVINHLFLVVGRKSKMIVLITSFIICHLSLSNSVSSE